MILFLCIYLYIYILVILFVNRKWGWDIYKAFESAAKTENGYSGMKDVNKPKSFKDTTESFFSAETLKYLYLLFDANHKIDLKEYVFNTEAHPFKLD